MPVPRYKRPSRRQSQHMGGLMSTLRSVILSFCRQSKKEGEKMPRNLTFRRQEAQKLYKWADDKNVEDIQKSTREETEPLNFTVTLPRLSTPIKGVEHELLLWAWSPYEKSNEILGELQLLNERLRIRRGDVMTLEGNNWLNDEVINFYLGKIVKRSDEPGRQAVHAFKTQFYPKLLQSGYASIKKWTKGVDIFEKRFLLIPIHLGVHWCLAVVDFELKRIDYYDSMLDDNWECVFTIVSYLCQESLEKRSTRLEMSEWSVVCRKDIPRQTNGYDCGVFLCIFAEHISRGAAFDFRGSGEEMALFRRRITYEMCAHCLLSDSDPYLQ